MITIRNGIPGDIPEMRTLLVDTVSSICRKDYSPDQIRVWLEVATNQKRWADTLQSQYVIIAEKNGGMVGFATLKGNDYLDFLYVHRLFQRQGIARRLMAELVCEAVKRGVTVLYSDVSITARPFFEREGFNVIEERKRVIGAVAVGNFKMSRRFSK